MTTKLQLDAKLDALEASLPKMLEENPGHGDFWMAFAGEADLIEDHAGEHAGHVNDRIESMLAKHGRYIAGVEMIEDEQG